MAYNVKFLKGTAAQYAALSKDANTFYYIDGTDLYLGEIKLSNAADLAGAIARISTNETDIAGIKEQLAALTSGENSVDSKIAAAVKELADGAVASNTAAIAKLNGAVTEEGSVLKMAKDAADAKDTAIKAAQDAADAAQADVDALEKLVGTIPADAAAKTVVAYAKEVADAAAGDASQVADDLAAEIERATGAEEALAGRLTTLEGDDAGKSVRAIANAELAAQLIPENAKEALDTLQEIAAWIQAHPDDAAAMNSAIKALQGVVGDASKGLVKDVADNKAAIEAEVARAEGVEGGLQTAIDAINNAETGILKTAKDYADGLDDAMDERVAALETAVGEDGSVAAQITAEIQKLDAEEVGGAGKYIKSIKEVDGIIVATAGDATDFDAAGSANTAETNAKAYTDTALTWGTIA